MITIRPAAERGHANLGWLKTHYSFSFADYYDPRYMGFRALRVINEDRVRAGKGFGMHPHRDMEIVTYVLQGELAHRDSMGNGSVIRPGEIQRMSAGTGVLHSEVNPSASETVHLLQIWIEPRQLGLKPSYEQKVVGGQNGKGKFRLIASSDGRDGSVTIHQDATISAAALSAEDGVSHGLSDGRGAWVQVISGEVDLNGKRLHAGDGAAITDEPVIRLTGKDQTRTSECLLFDLG